MDDIVANVATHTNSTGTGLHFFLNNEDKNNKSVNFIWDIN